MECRCTLFSQGRVGMSERKASEGARGRRGPAEQAGSAFPGPSTSSAWCMVVTGGHLVDTG